MATRISTQLRTDCLTGPDTSFDNGQFRIYTGLQPATGDTAATGTLLVTITLPADAFGSVASGVMAKSGTWSAIASANGTAGWCRMANIADTVRIDGVVPGELTLDNPVIASGGTVTINTCTVTMPAA